jgi:PPOX class probable F420-dependent enzyme
VSGVIPPARPPEPRGPSESREPARARRWARPVPGRRLPAALPMARLGAKAAPRGARVIAEVAREGSREQLAAAKRTLIVSFRRDGRPVPTPVWAAPAGEVFYVRTERASGKVKRLRRDPHVLIAPCAVNGRPLGAPLEASARVLDGVEEELAAERALAARYGRGRELFERAMDFLRVDMCYLELRSEPWS